MKTLKIPTNKQLNLNLKQSLWNYQPATFLEWKSIAEKDFIVKLKIYLKETNQMSLFSDIYQIMFYYGFVNFRKELLLKNLLEKNGYSVVISNLNYDAIWQIDLIAVKNSEKLFIQLKSNHNISDSNIQKLKTFAINKNAIPVLSTKHNHYFELTNLLNFSKTKISMYNINNKKQI